MEINLKINWEERQVMTCEHYEKVKVPATVKEWMDDSDTLASWLFGNYDPYDIWVMDEDDRKSVWVEFEDYCERKALDELADSGWEDFLLEI